MKWFSIGILVLACCSAAIAQGSRGKMVIVANDKNLVDMDATHSHDSKTASVSDVLSGLIGGPLGWGGTHDEVYVLGNLLYRPQGNLLVVVEGADPAYLRKETFMTGKPAVALDLQTSDADVFQWTKVAAVVAQEEKGMDRQLLVASADSTFTDACTAQRDDCVGYTVGSTQYPESALLEAIHLNMESIWGAYVLKATNDLFVFGDGDSKIILSLNSAVHKQFLLEVGLLSVIANEGDAKKMQSTGTAMVINVMSSTLPFLAQFKEGTKEHKFAQQLVWHTVNALVQSWSKVFPGRFTSEIVAVPRDGALARRRRLLSNAAQANALNKNYTAGYTQVQIEDYQLFLWTSIILSVFVLMAVCMFFNLDVENDRTLYNSYLVKKKGL